MITVTKDFNRYKKTLIITDDFFDSDVIVKVSDDKIVFSKPTLNFKGQTRIPTSMKNGKFKLNVVCEIPEGIYEFDKEESNDDCRVFYY